MIEPKDEMVLLAGIDYYHTLSLYYIRASDVNSVTCIIIGHQKLVQLSLESFKETGIYFLILRIFTSSNIWDVKCLSIYSEV